MSFVITIIISLKKKASTTVLQACFGVCVGDVFSFSKKKHFLTEFAVKFKIKVFLYRHVIL